MQTGKIAALFSIFLGLFMMVMWAVLLGAGLVPELKTEPYQMAYHLAAELLTAAALLAGGIGLLSGRRWGVDAFLLAMGLFLYAVILATGYFAQTGGLLMFAVHTIVTVITMVIIGLIFFNRDLFKPEIRP